MLADSDMHPAYIRKAAYRKQAESSVTYIEASLSKALKANNLLSGNDPSEGWGSQYSGNPKSLSRFLPEKFFKKLPPQAGNSLKRGASVSSTISSDSASSLLQEEYSLIKHTKVSNQGKLQQ